MFGSPPPPPRPPYVGGLIDRSITIDKIKDLRGYVSLSLSTFEMFTTPGAVEAHVATDSCNFFPPIWFSSFSFSMNFSCIYHPLLITPGTA